MDEKQPAQKYLACIRALTDQCAALIWEQDELKKQVLRYEKNGVTCQTYGHKIDSSCSECNVHENYTTPPKREWVGITDEQRLKALESIDPQTVRLPPGFKRFAESIEKLLKEKNFD